MNSCSIQALQFSVICYRTCFEYWNRPALANSVVPDQTPQNAASDLGQHCLQLIQQFSGTSTNSKIGLFTFKDENGKE